MRPSPLASFSRSHRSAVEEGPSMSSTGALITSRDADGPYFSALAAVKVLSAKWNEPRNRRKSFRDGNEMRVTKKRAGRMWPNTRAISRGRANRSCHGWQTMPRDKRSRFSVTLHIGTMLKTFTRNMHNDSLRMMVSHIATDKEKKEIS